MSRKDVTDFLPPVPGGTRKRQTISERTDRMRDTDEANRVEFLALVVKKAKESRDFRWHAPKTQDRQNHHLSMYTNFLCMFYHDNKAPADSTNEQLQDIRFPEDFEELYEQLRNFMVYVHLSAAPRSRLTGDRVSYRTLARYRDSMLFWAARSYRQRKLNAPPRGLLFHHMTEAMQSQQLRDSGPGFKRQNKTYLGLGELRELFDYEMLHNRSIANSEQHQAAWVIARYTACRPGSLCPSGKWGRNKPLTWRDLDFTCSGAGKFEVVIHLDISIKRPNDPDDKSHQTGNDVLPVKLDTPDSNNIIFSAPHRLLVIALRRGLLKGISTLDELLNFESYNVEIEDYALDYPVFYASVPKGTDIDKTKPMSAFALTEYLKARGVSLGYTQPITMYSIRRRAATDMVVRVGAEATRRHMGHSPESYSLERFYMSMSQLTDTTSIALGQTSDVTAYSTALINKWSPLALGKLSDAQLRRTRGLVLQDMMKKLILADENPPDSDDPRELKQYRKRQRAYAQQALIEQQAALAKSQLSQADFRDRQLQLEKSTTFAKAVMERAHELSQAGQEPDADAEAAIGDDEEEWNGFPDSEPPEEDFEATARADPEREPGSIMSMVLEGEFDEEAGPDRDTVPDAADVPFKDIAAAFMSTLLENPMNIQKTWADRDRTCPECRVDETTTADDKAKQWKSAAHLDRHLEGSFHTALEKWSRAEKKLAQERPDKLFYCRYCLGAGLSEEEAYKIDSLGELRRHVRDSNAGKDGEKHDALKADDGWYSGDMQRTSSEPAKKEQARVTRKNIAKLGFKIKQPRQVIGNEPYPDFPGVVRGPMLGGVPKRFAHAFSNQSLPPPTERQRRGLSSGLSDSFLSGGIPVDFRNSIVRGGVSGGGRAVEAGSAMQKGGGTGEEGPMEGGSAMLEGEGMGEDDIVEEQGLGEDDPMEEEGIGQEDDDAMELDD